MEKIWLFVGSTVEFAASGIIMICSAIKNKDALKFTLVIGIAGTILGLLTV